MAKREGRLSGKRMNRLVDNIAARVIARRDQLAEKMLEDGYPIGMEPLSPVEQFHQLAAWRERGDPRFWQSPDAQAELSRLEIRFGGVEGIHPPLMTKGRARTGSAALSQIREPQGGSNGSPR